MRRGRTLAVLAFAVAVATLVPVRVPAQQLAPYDAFGEPTLDPARWRGYEHTIPATSVLGGGITGCFGCFHDDSSERTPYSGAGHSPYNVENTESRREIVNGRARLSLTTWAVMETHDGDHAQGRGRLGLRVSAPALADHEPMVRAMQASVTIRSVRRRTECTHVGGPGHSGRAAVYGVFFNDGGSTGPRDRTGDVSVELGIESTAAGDGST